MIHRVVQKILCDKVCAILVVPEWPTASWYPLIMKMCLKPPRMLPRTKYLLKLPQQPDRIHPLHPKLRLLACLVSGECLQNRAYQRPTLSVIMSSWRPATCAQYASYVYKWIVFLHERKLSLDSLITVNIVLEFLTSLHEQGLSYSAINTARSAVSVDGMFDR